MIITDYPNKIDTETTYISAEQSRQDGKTTLSFRTGNGHHLIPFATIDTRNTCIHDKPQDVDTENLAIAQQIVGLWNTATSWRHTFHHCKRCDRPDLWQEGMRLTADEFGDTPISAKELQKFIQFYVGTLRKDLGMEQPDSIILMATKTYLHTLDRRSLAITGDPERGHGHFKYQGRHIIVVQPDHPHECDRNRLADGTCAVCGKEQ